MTNAVCVCARVCTSVSVALCVCLSVCMYLSVRRHEERLVPVGDPWLTAVGSHAGLGWALLLRPPTGLCSVSPPE